MQLSLSWRLVSFFHLSSGCKANLLAPGFAVTAVVALLLNLSLPYDVEDDTEVLAETDAQVATFTEHNAEIGMSKEIPEVGEKKVDDLEA